MQFLESSMLGVRSARLSFASPTSPVHITLVIHARDRRLLEKLTGELDDDGGPLRLAVVYGAGHMRAVVREITGARGFFVEATEWRSVFQL
jgi:hypothetical protein